MKKMRKTTSCSKRTTKLAHIERNENQKIYKIYNYLSTNFL